MGLCPNGKGTIAVCEESQNDSGVGLFLFSVMTLMGGLRSLFGWYKDPCGTESPS